MQAEALKKPDEAAMGRILARHPYSPEGVILRLAWQEGLSRKDAVRQVAAETGLAKNQLYDAALRAQHTETE